MAITKQPFGEVFPAYRPIEYEFTAESVTANYTVELATVDVYKGLDLIAESLPFAPVNSVKSLAVFTISTNPNTVNTVMPNSYSVMSIIGQPYTQGSPASATTIDFPAGGTSVPNNQILQIIKDALELNPYLNSTFDFSITNTGGAFPVYILTGLAKAEGTIPNFTIDLGTINSPNVRLPTALQNYGINTTAYFEIDIQGICQDTLSPFKGLPEAFTTGYIDNVETYSSYRIEVSYKWLNYSTNLLEDSTIDADTPSPVRVFACTRQHTDSMFLNEFFGTITDTNNKFLTYSPRLLEICRDEERWLSYIQPVVDEEDQWYNYIEVKVFGGGLLLSEGISATAGGSGSRQYAINTSIEALNNLFYFNSSPDFTNPAADTYTVSIGRNLNAPNLPQSSNDYFRESEIFSYKIKDHCCPNSPLLHWLNGLGAVDSFRFRYLQGEVIESDFKSLQSPLNWVIGSNNPHSIQDTGKFKNEIEASTNKVITTGAISRETALFLKDVVMSPKVYLEENGNLIPVVVTSKQFATKAGKGVFEVTLQIQLANDSITLSV